MRGNISPAPPVPSAPRGGELNPKRAYALINIIGSRFPVSYWGEDRVDIGCQSRSIDEWLNDYTDIAKEHNFTVGQIEEYHGYVEFIESLHSRKDNGPVTGEQTGGKV
jgi:hypothetical protein